MFSAVIALLFCILLQCSGWYAKCGASTD